MNILFLTIEYPPYIDGGVGVFSENLIKHLSIRKDIFLDILLPNRGKYSLVTRNKNLNFFQAQNKNIKFLSYFGYINQVNKIISINKYDLVYSSIPNLLFSTNDKIIPKVATVHHPGALAKRLKSNFITKYLDPSSEMSILPISPYIEKKSIRSCNDIISVSDEARLYYKDKFNIPENTIQTIHNGVPDRVYVKPSEKNLILRKFNIKDNEKYLLFVGSLTERKGLSLLLRSLSKIKYKNIKLLVVGLGKIDYYKKLAQKYKCLDRVFFLGFLNQSDLNAIYKISSIFILPSYLEGFPTVILEAMFFELPIISSDTFGGKEIVTKKNGLLFKRGKYLDLLEKLETMLDSGNYKVNVLERFSWEKSAELYYQTFQKYS